MSVKNTKDGSFTIDTSTSEIVQANITYQGLVNATYPTIYTIIGEMCILLLPTIKETPISSSPSTIQIIVPPELTPSSTQNIHGFTVNDADGTENSVLQMNQSSYLFTLGIDLGDGTLGPYNNTSDVSITRYRYIMYPIYTN